MELLRNKVNNNYWQLNTRNCSKYGFKYLVYADSFSKIYYKRHTILVWRFSDLEYTNIQKLVLN